MIEEWRPVVGYEGLYEVSDRGRVRSFPRQGTGGGLVSQRLNNRGYPIVSMTRPGHWATRTVHRLVTEAFIGPRPGGMEVRHLDGNRANAQLSNLSYGTRSENNLDAVGHGTHFQAAKTHCPKGHPYDGANTYVLPSRPSARYCRACNRVRSAERRRVSPLSATSC